MLVYVRGFLLRYTALPSNVVARMDSRDRCGGTAMEVVGVDAAAVAISFFLPAYGLSRSRISGNSSANGVSIDQRQTNPFHTVTNLAIEIDLYLSLNMPVQRREVIVSVPSTYRGPTRSLP